MPSNPEWTRDLSLAVSEAIKIPRLGVSSILRAPTETSEHKLVAVKVNSEDASIKRSSVNDSPTAKIEWVWSPDKNPDLNQQPIQPTQYGGISEALKPNETQSDALLRGTRIEIASHATNEQSKNTLLQLFACIRYTHLAITPFKVLQVRTRLDDEGQREYIARGLIYTNVGILDLTQAQYDIMEKLGLVADLEDLLNRDSNCLRDHFAHLVKLYRQAYKGLHV